MVGGFSRKGKTLLSGVDPAGRADRTADAVSAADRTLYLCPSPLYGYGLEHLLARLSGFTNSAVLCVEADPELFALSREYFPPALLDNPKLRLTSESGDGALCALVRREWGPRFFRRVETVRFTGGWQLFPHVYDALEDSLRREIALDWGNAITLAKLGRRYIRNALSNLALIPRFLSLDKISFGGDPALILGAGPSLDNSLDALQAHYGDTLKLPQTRSFRIICADTCLPVLKDRGITPDLAVVLESQHWNLDDFTGLSGWKVPVAFDLSALPRSASALAGDVYLFFTPWTRLTIFERLESAGLLPLRQPPLGSVGLSAVSIARCLTRGAIVCAGLDFSFTLDSFHARSTPGHARLLRRQNRFTGLFNAEAAFGAAVQKTSAKNGGAVFTNPALRNYRDLFEREFGADNGDASRFFDIDGSGLSLGIRTLSSEEAIKMLSSEYLAQRRKGAEIGSLFENGSLSSVPPCLREIKFGIIEKLEIFIRGETDRLMLLRKLLTGEAPMDHASLDSLIDECDYLWAHFPDYAAAERRPGKTELEAGSPSAISFLKRLRVEIDPFLRILKRVNG